MEEEGRRIQEDMTVEAEVSYRMANFEFGERGHSREIQVAS